MLIERSGDGRGARRAGGGDWRGAPGFALGIVVMGAMMLCEAVGTGAAGYLTYIHTKSKKKSKIRSPIGYPHKTIS